MTQVKQNPLPVGRYWVDIREKYVPDFTAFLRIVGRGIMVIQTKEREDPFTTGGKNTGYLFEVRNPLIPWDSTKFGWPNTADGILDLDATGTVPSAQSTLPSWFNVDAGQLGNGILVLLALAAMGSCGAG